MAVDRRQQAADDVFAAALVQRDEDALATECTRRLMELQSGASLSFRAGEDRPYVWSMPVWNKQAVPPYAEWGRQAAQALLDEVSS